MPSTEQERRNKALIRALIEAADRGDRSAVDRYYSRVYVDHTPTPGRSTAPGIEGMRRAFEMFLHAFPDTRHEIHDLIAEGDRVVARISALATHTGEIMGVAPTGKPVSLEAIAIYRITDDKIVERWSFEGTSLLEQLRGDGASA